MAKYMKLYLCMAKMNFKVMKQYKFDMIVGALSTLLMQISSIIFLWTIFDNVKVFAGWTYSEVLLVYGIFTLCRGLNHIFFDNLWIIGKEFIRRGTFDILLVRPANELFQIVGQKIQIDGVGTFVLGIAVTKVAADGLDLTLTISNVCLWLLIILMGTLIIASINLIFAVSSFWVIRSNNIIWMIFSFADFAQYPLEAFGLGIKFVLTVVIPYGFVSYYPVSCMLGKESFLYIVYELGILFVLVVLALKLWKFGMKKYESAGN